MYVQVNAGVADTSCFLLRPSVTAENFFQMFFKSCVEQFYQLSAPLKGGRLLEVYWGQ